VPNSIELNDNEKKVVKYLEINKKNHIRWCRKIVKYQRDNGKENTFQYG